MNNSSQIELCPMSFVVHNGPNQGEIVRGGSGMSRIHFHKGISLANYIIESLKSIFEHIQCHINSAKVVALFWNYVLPIRPHGVFVSS